MLERQLLGSEQEDFFGADYTLVGVSTRRPALSRRRAASQRCAATGIRLDRQGACPVQARVTSCGRRWPAGHSARRSPRGTSRDKSRGCGRRPGAGVCLGGALLPIVCLADVQSGTVEALGQDEASFFEDALVGIAQAPSLEAELAANTAEELTGLCQDQQDAYELGPAGLALPEHSLPADLGEEPIMEVQVAPDLPNQLPDEQPETEDLEGMWAGAGVTLPPLVLEQDWFMISDLVQQLPDELPEDDEQGGADAGVIFSEPVLQVGFFEECAVSLKPEEIAMLAPETCPEAAAHLEVADSLPCELDRGEDHLQGPDVVMPPLAFSMDMTQVPCLLQVPDTFPDLFEDDLQGHNDAGVVHPPPALSSEEDFERPSDTVGVMAPTFPLLSNPLEVDEDAVSVLSLGGSSCRSYEDEAAVAAEEVACFVVQSPLGKGSLDLFVGDPPLEDELSSLQQELALAMDDVRSKSMVRKIPVASQLGPCPRRSFARQLLPWQRPPPMEQLMPGLIPLSKAVATLHAPGGIAQLSDEVESRPCSSAAAHHADLCNEKVDETHRVSRRPSYHRRRPHLHRILLGEPEAPASASCPATPTKMKEQLSPRHARQPPCSPTPAQAPSALRTGCLSPTSSSFDCGRQSACSVPAQARASRHHARFLQAMKQDWMLTPRTGMEIDSTNFIREDVSSSSWVPNGSRWPQTPVLVAGEFIVGNLSPRAKQKPGLLPALKSKPVQATVDAIRHASDGLILPHGSVTQRGTCKFAGRTVPAL